MTSRRKARPWLPLRWTAACAFAFWLVLWVGRGSAQQGAAAHDPLAVATPGAELAASAQALEDGRPSEAIARLEQLADLGHLHPDLSYNRGLAYFLRAEGSTPELGDFGQAAAGFAEAVQARPKDEVAARALEEVQMSAARKRAGQENTVTDPLGLVERVVLALHPLALFAVAVMGSVTASVGLALFGRDNPAHRTISILALAVGCLALGFGFGSELLRRSLETEHRVAVVTAGKAQLLDASGKPLGGEPALLETTVVHLAKPEHGLAPLLSLGPKKWIRLSQVRVVSQPVVSR